MLDLFIEQLNVFYKVAGKPLIEYPLNETQQYLVALELQRAMTGIYHDDPDVPKLVAFYHEVYLELSHESHH